MDKIYELAYVLEHIEEFNWSDALFLPEDEKWNLKTKCMILDLDDVDEVPKQDAKKNLIYTLDIQTIQSINKNAYEQKKDCSRTDLVEAFLYYYDYDAYIKF